MVLCGSVSGESGRDKRGTRREGSVEETVCDLITVPLCSRASGATVSWIRGTKTMWRGRGEERGERRGR